MKWKTSLILLAALAVCPAALVAQESPTEDAAGAGETPAQRVQYELEDSTLVMTVGEQQGRMNLPCKARELAEAGAKVYVACGEKGVFVVSVADPTEPEGLGFRNLGGPVTGLFEAQGRVWAQIERVEARPVEDAAPDAAAATGRRVVVERRTEEEPEQVEEKAEEKDKKKSTAVVEGEVVEQREGNVIISVGRAQGVERGDRVELLAMEDVALGGGEDAKRERSLAVGRVTAVSESRAEVDLGINERVPQGALARLTSKELTEEPLLPPRLGDIWEIEFMVRPFLALGTLGAGSVGHLSATRRFESQMALQFNVNPLSFGVAEDGNVLALGGDANLAYDTRAFAIGLGAGAFSIHHDGWERTEESQDVAFGLTQVARLGARDGLNLEARNAFVLVDGEFEYGGTDGSVQVPLDIFSSNTWLIARGGGHISGDYYGEVGLRVLVHGNGDRGSIFVMPTLGGAAVEGSEEVACPDYESERTVCYDEHSYGGPMVGFGMEWRI